MKRAVIVVALVLTVAGVSFAQSTPSYTPPLQGLTGPTIVNDVMLAFLAPIQRGIMIAIQWAQKFVTVLLALDVCWMGLMIVLGRGDNLGAIVVRLIGLGVIWFVVNNFALNTTWSGAGEVTYNITSADTGQTATLGPSPGQTLTEPTGRDPWQQMVSNPSWEPSWSGRGAFNEAPGLAIRFLHMLVGISAASAGVTGDILNNPGLVLVFADNALVSPLVVSLETVHSGRSFWQFVADMFNPFYNAQTASAAGEMPSTLDLQIMSFFYKVTIYVIYGLLTIQLCLAVVEFYLILLFAQILVPFIAFEPLRFIGTNAFTAVIGQAVRLAIVVTIVTLGVSVMDNVAKEVFGRLVQWNADGTVTAIPGAAGVPELISLVMLIVSSMLLAYLATHAPNLATALLTGAPAFSTGHFLQNAYAAARLGQGVMGGIYGVARWGTQAYDGVRDRIQGGSGAAAGGHNAGPPAVAAATPAASAGGESGVAGGPKPEFAPVAPDVTPLIGAAFGMARTAGTKVTLPAGARTTGLFLPTEGRQTIDTGPLPYEQST